MGMVGDTRRAPMPFAVSTGRSGAMYGIGVGIVLALTYWLALSVFGALGSGGWISSPAYCSNASWANISRDRRTQARISVQSSSSLI